MRYRVRLLSHPIILYNGHSFELAAQYLDSILYDRVLERHEHDGWRSVISIQGGRG